MSFEIKEDIISYEIESINGDEIKTTQMEKKEVKKDNQQVNTVNIYRSGETQVKIVSGQNNNQQNNKSTIPTTKKIENVLLLFRSL